MTNAELSAEIARRLFGWTHGTEWVFASDHNAAMGLVVPEMRKRGYEFSLVDGYYTKQSANCEFYNTVTGRRSAVWTPRGEEPRGICEAARAALDSEEAK